MANLLESLLCVAMLTAVSQELAGDSVSVGDSRYWRHEFRASTFTPSAQGEAAYDFGWMGRKCGPAVVNRGAA